MLDHSRNISLLTIILSACLLLSACLEKEEPVIEQRIRPVKVVTVSTEPTDIYRRFAGGSQAAISSKLSFRTSGQVVELAVKVGQNIDRGSLIARLNDSDLRIQLEREEASHRQAIAQAKNSRSQFERIQNLLDRKLVSKVDFDNAQASDQATQAQLDQVVGSVELSRKQLGYTQLVAPADGCIVSEVHIEVNENVTTGEPVATLNCGTTIEVKVALPENLIYSVTLGDTVNVNFPSLKKRNFPAIISEIGSASSANTAFPVTVRLANDDNLLRPGMAAEISFHISNAQLSDNLWIPLIAVGSEGAQRFIYLYDATDERRGVVKRQNIEIGDFTLKQVEVLKGVAEGDRVVVAGLSQIYPGLEVKLLSADEKPL